MKRATMRFFMTVITLLLAACGGGGGGGTPTAPSKTTAVLKIGTQGNLDAGVLLYGVGVTITLPKGVTVAVDNSGNVGGTVAIASGVVSRGSVTATYAAATSTLRLIVASGGAGFGTGEFVTVTCLLPAGNSLQASDFSTSILGSLEPANQQLKAVTGLTPTISATLY